MFVERQVQKSKEGCIMHCVKAEILTNFQRKMINVAKMKNRDICLL